MKTLQNLLKKIILLAALFASCGSVMAAGVDLVGDDTDLFTTNPNIPAQVPNVLFVVDNTASWDNNSNGWNVGLDPICSAAGFPFGSTNVKQGYAELCAIYTESGKLSAGVNVGFMMFNAQNKGSYVRFPMQSMTSTAITNFQNILKVLQVGDNTEKVGSNSFYEDKFNDVFRYFNSLGTAFQNSADPNHSDPGGYTDSTKNNFKFITGQNGDTCGFDYIIFIGNTFPNTMSWTAYPASGGAADLITAANLLNDPNVTFGTNNADLVPLQNTGGNADLWSKFMFKYGVKVANGSYRHVTTYTINVCSYSATGADTCPTDNPGGASQTTMMKSMAAVSNGKYFSASNLSQIQTALAQIFAEVQAVNSVFAATTLPVSINVRGTNLNQVYIGVFRPDSLASPRWLGNLKQYQLGVNSVTGALQLVDANLAQAVNLNTGFISNSATSFWTTAYDADPNTAGTQGFWSFRSPFASTDVGQGQDSPDGDLVEKGGAAERMRVLYPLPDSNAAQTRNIYTCTGGCTAGSSLSGTPFNVANTDITGTLLGTYQNLTVTSLTSSGTTATATTATPHGFVTGNSVQISNAVPNVFTGVYSITVTGLNTFTYTLSSAPDPTVAYVTQPGYILTPGVDFVIVQSATPAAYNVTGTPGAGISAVTGQANQYSYSITGTPTPTTAASSYEVTGVRRVQATGGTQILWSSASAGFQDTTVTLANHGYSSGNNVVISGSTDAAFNTAATGSTIVVTDSNHFTYTASGTPASVTNNTGIATPTGGIPAGWSNNTSVRVTGATPSTFNTASAGAPITVSGSTFSYTPTSGTVVGSATGASAQRIENNDKSTWTVGAPTFVTGSVNQSSTWNVPAGSATSGGGLTASPLGTPTCPTTAGSCLRLTLDKAALNGGAALHKIAVGDSITIPGSNTCSFWTGSGGSKAQWFCNGTFIIRAVAGDSSAVATPSGTLQALSNQVQIDFQPVTQATPLAVNGTGSGGTNPPTIATTASCGGQSNIACATFSGSGTLATKIRFPLTRGQYHLQALHTLAVGDTITIQDTNGNLNACTFISGGTTNCVGQSPATTVTVNAITGDSGVGSATATDTYGDITGTVYVDVVPTGISGASVGSGVTAVATGAGLTPATNATLIIWNGQTIGPAVTLATLVAGAASANAPGTIYASKFGTPGDLTSKVTSISNGSTATGNITAALTTAPDLTERDKLIYWVRGQDNKDDENKRDGSLSTPGVTCATTNTCDIRASVHGDVLHSRPAVINYNRTAGNNDVYVFYGANDGMFHAVQGGQASGGGNEQWAFIAQEHFGKLKRLRDQTPSISSNYPKGYFFDGPIGVYTLDANSDSQLTSGLSGDKVYLYTAMRRGGRQIYAFDVTDPTAPKLLWKKGCTNATGTGAAGGCDAGWDTIGQTWSQPQVVYLRAYPTTPVLIFGAGYDAPAEDFQPCYVTTYSSTSVTGKTGLTPPTPMSAANCPPAGGGSSTQTRTMGQGVYIVNALTGAVLWRAGPDAAATMVVSGMNYSITADLAILRNRTNTAGRTLTPGIENVPTGYMDRIYAPDTGGNVWRLDVADADPANWVVSKLGALATSSASSTTTGTPAAADMRKFEFQPDVVYSSNPTTGALYDAVLLGSGDREHPFDMVVNNRFYMIRDLNTTTLAPSSTPTAITESDLFDITDGCLQQASLCPAGVTQAQAQSSLDSALGWKFLFAPTNIGEKTVSSATTAASTVIFNTNQPKQDTVTGTSTNVGSNASNSCTSDLGTARQYGLNFQTGNSQNIFSTLPTQYVPTAGLGRFATFAGGGFLPTPVPVVVQIGGKYYQTIIAGVQTTNPGGLKLQSRLRTYWYRKTD